MMTDNIHHNSPFNEWRELPMTKAWRDALTERERAEVDFCMIYATSFAHGTDGHNGKIIIAKLSTMLDGLTSLCERIEAQRMELIMPKDKSHQ